MTSGISANANDVIYLEKDKPAPFTGYLFTEAKEKEVRFKLIESDFNEKRVILSNNIIKDNTVQIDIIERRVENMRKQNDELSKDLLESRSSTFWQYSLFFITGALITGGISYGVIKTMK